MNIPGMMRGAAVAVALWGMSGCAYMNVRVPLDTDFEKTELGNKEGHASTYTVGWAVSWGDAGTKAAAQEGGLSVIRHADREVLSVLMGLYTRVTTVVYGD